MRIFLRPITEKDTSTIVKWRNSDTVRSHCMTKSKITEKSHLDFLKKNIVSGKYKQFIVERIEEETGLVSYPIATVYLKDMDKENKRCELCIFTSDDVEWDSEGQRIAIRMLLEKTFNEYGIYKVYSFVFERYPEEIELLKNAGFKIEAILQNESLDLDGTRCNVVRMCAFNNKFINQ